VLEHHGDGSALPMLVQSGNLRFENGPYRLISGVIPVPPCRDQQEIYLAIWSKAIDTQMHFNEMSVKSRQFGLGFVAAALGLGIVLLTRREDFSIPIALFGGFTLHATVLVALASALALYAVELLDLNVYHKMLRGAVAFGEDFEQNYMKQIFCLEKGMTQAISHFSRINDAYVETRDGKYHYLGEKKEVALEKLKCFYRVSIGALLAVAVILFTFTAHSGTQGQGSSQSSGGDISTPKQHAQ
jgi:hypothetical protein